MRKLMLTTAVTGTLVIALALRTDGTPVTQSRAAAPSFQIGITQEPILNWDVTGGTLSGPFHTRLTVYNNGLVTGSSCTGLGGSNSAGTAYASTAEVEKLRKELIDAGGLKLADQNISVADIPLTTVTVFKGTTDASAHTFSYWIGTGNYGKIAQIISDFATKHPVTCQGIILQSE